MLHAFGTIVSQQCKKKRAPTSEYMSGADITLSSTLFMLYEYTCPPFCDEKHVIQHVIEEERERVG